MIIQNPDSASALQSPVRNVIYTPPSQQRPPSQPGYPGHGALANGSPYRYGQPVSVNGVRAELGMYDLWLIVRSLLICVGTEFKPSPFYAVRRQIGATQVCSGMFSDQVVNASGY